MTARPAAERFDAAFYRRHYRDRRTRVVSPAEMRRRAQLISAFVGYAELPVRSILDVGCGLGLLGRALLDRFPRARYTGLEVSEYLCARHGWEHGSIATYEPGHRYDLVVCYDVLQYLDAAEAAAAMRNLGRLTAGVLHFGALTSEDWREHCDQRRTDRNVNLRPADWYRRRLQRAFVNAGCGMFVKRDAPLRLWELERAQRTGRVR